MGVHARESPEEHRVRHREDGGIDRDTKGKRHHGDDGEAGRAPHASERVPDILSQ
jgi:hypothetical protein